MFANHKFQFKRSHSTLLDCSSACTSCTSLLVRQRWFVLRLIGQSMPIIFVLEAFIEPHLACIGTSALFRQFMRGASALANCGSLLYLQVHADLVQLFVPKFTLSLPKHSTPAVKSPSSRYWTHRGSRPGLTCCTSTNMLASP